MLAYEFRVLDVDGLAKSMPLPQLLEWIRFFRQMYDVDDDQAGQPGPRYTSPEHIESFFRGMYGR